MNKQFCQIKTLNTVHNGISRMDYLCQRTNKLIHSIKKRIRYFRRFIISKNGADSEIDINSKIQKCQKLKSGDLVLIKSRKEITKTLDNWNKLKGCAFMEEMWEYCGTKQRVFKRINQFMDERDYLIKKTSGIVILEDVYCEGAKDFGPCDRSCFFFWREEWLIRIEN